MAASSCFFAVEHGEKDKKGQEGEKEEQRRKVGKKGRDKLVAQRGDKRNGRTKDRDVRRSHVLTPRKQRQKSFLHYFHRESEAEMMALDQMYSDIAPR